MSISHDAIVAMLTNEFGPPSGNDDLQKGIGWDVGDVVGLYMRNSANRPFSGTADVLVFVPTSTLISMPDFGTKVEATGKQVGRSLGSFKFAGMGANHDVLKLRITDTSELQWTVDYVRGLLGTAIGSRVPQPAATTAAADPIEPIRRFHLPKRTDVRRSYRRSHGGKANPSFVRRCLSDMGDSA